ncbi:hypothetical protein [Streptomyces galbus]|uniref:hypothetical protein n=1 Tax=Streptomyces galbus TaxID=33898 RepID=UPI003EBFFFB8
MTTRPVGRPDVFDHRMAECATDPAFLAAALPFLEEGLAAPASPRPSPSPPPTSWTCCATRSAARPPGSAWSRTPTGTPAPRPTPWPVPPVTSPPTPVPAAGSTC